MPVDSEEEKTRRRNEVVRRMKFNWALLALRMKVGRISGWRLAHQAGFTFVSILLGIQFTRFVAAARGTSQGSLPTRPPGVEGYLPISGLMGAVDWVYQGALNTIHPAATIMFLVFVLISLLLRKGFCGWICPVGFISENLARLGQAILGRNLRLPRQFDVPLRGLKYVLLGFFLWAIFTMSPQALHAFIESPYNKVSDVKMLEFFLDLSTTAGVVLIVLAILSVVVHSFWCRYLCPYGAWMGLFSWASPVKVRRNRASCTGCGICDRVCPARLPVSQKDVVSSVECIGCTDCVVSCPAPTALRFGTRKRTLDPLRTGILIAVVFAAAMVAARGAGHWHNRLSADEIRYHVARMHTGEYGHPGMQKTD